MGEKSGSNPLDIFPSAKKVYEALLASEIRDLSIRESKQEAQDLICDLLLREPNPKLQFLIDLSIIKIISKKQPFILLRGKPPSI
jgi:hypothetical protein